MHKRPATRLHCPTGSTLRVEMLEDRRVLSVAPWWQQVLIHHYQTTEPVAAQTSLVLKHYLHQNDDLVVQSNVNREERVSINEPISMEPTPAADTTVSESPQTDSAPATNTTELTQADKTDWQPVAVSTEPATSTTKPADEVLSKPAVENTLTPRQLVRLLENPELAQRYIKKEILADRPAAQELPVETLAVEGNDNAVVLDMEKPIGPFERPADERFLLSPAQDPASVSPEKPAIASLLPVAVREAEAIRPERFQERGTPPTALRAMNEREQDEPVGSAEAPGAPANLGHDSAPDVAAATPTATVSVASFPRARDSQPATEALTVGTELAAGEISVVAGDLVFSEAGSEEEVLAADISAEPQEAGLMEEGQPLDESALEAAVQQFLNDVGQLGDQTGETLSSLEVSALAAAVVIGAVGWGTGRRFRRKKQPALGLGTVGGGSTLTWMPDSADYC